MNCNERTTRQMLNSLVAAVAAFGLVTASTLSATSNDDANTPQASQDTSSALVQLNEGGAVLYSQHSGGALLRHDTKPKDARVIRQRRAKVAHLEPHAPDARLVW